MTFQPAAAKRYLEDQVLSASPVKLVSLLFAGALRYLDRAEAAMQRGDRAESGKQVSQAMAIVSELRACLNLEAGQQIARNLEELYRFVLQQLFEANLQQKPEYIAAARSILQPVKEGFDAIGR